MIWATDHKGCGNSSLRRQMEGVYSPLNFFEDLCLNSHASANSATLLPYFSRMKSLCNSRMLATGYVWGKWCPAKAHPPYLPGAHCSHSELEWHLLASFPLKQQGLTHKGTFTKFWYGEVQGVRQEDFSSSQVTKGISKTRQIQTLEEQWKTVH